MSNVEAIRSSFDIDGTRVELIFDADKNRYSVATRWAFLAHFQVEWNTTKWQRIMLERASAVFEAVCMNGATKEVANVAKQKAVNADLTFFVSPAAYEKEVLRLTEKALFNI